jgi:outer membrane immunogenic protein
MRTLLLTALLSTVAMPAALAADMPTKAPRQAPVAIYNWSGFYIGGHVGYGWGDKDFSQDDIADFFGLDNPIASHSLRGVLGGAQAGFNIQSGALVFGVEGQFSWTGIDDETTTRLGFVFGPGNCTQREPCPVDMRIKSEIDWIATVAGRIGFAWDRVLLYAKGGVAFMDQKHTADGFIGTDKVHFANAKFGDTRTGWMVGGGLEYAFAGNWSAKIEYNFMDFSNETFNVVATSDILCGGKCGAVKVGVDDGQMHVVKFGINYRFGGN